VWRCGKKRRESLVKDYNVKPLSPEIFQRVLVFGNQPPKIPKIHTSHYIHPTFRLVVDFTQSPKKNSSSPKKTLLPRASGTETGNSHVMPGV
jgi:hypothetical protein